MTTSISVFEIRHGLERDFRFSRRPRQAAGAIFDFPRADLPPADRLYDFFLAAVPLVDGLFDFLPAVPLVDGLFDFLPAVRRGRLAPAGRPMALAGIRRTFGRRE